MNSEARPVRRLQSRLKRKLRAIAYAILALPRSIINKQISAKANDGCHQVEIMLNLSPPRTLYRDPATDGPQSPSRLPPIEAAILGALDNGALTAKEIAAAIGRKNNAYLWRALGALKAKGSIARASEGGYKLSRTPCRDPSTVTLSSEETMILNALGAGPLATKQIASAIGAKNDSRFRSVLAGLKRLGFIRMIPGRVYALA